MIEYANMDYFVYFILHTSAERKETHTQNVVVRLLRGKM